MKTFRDVLVALRRRAGDNTDPVPFDEVMGKVASNLGISKEALAGLITAPLRWGASGLANAINTQAGNFVKAPVSTAFSLMGPYFMGSQALAEKDRYNQMVTPKFPTKPRGVGLND